MNSPPSRFLYIHLNYRFIWFQTEYKPKRVNQESFKYDFLLNDKQKCFWLGKLWYLGGGKFSNSRIHVINLAAFLSDDLFT